MGVFSKLKWKHSSFGLLNASKIFNPFGKQWLTIIFSSNSELGFELGGNLLKITGILFSSLKKLVSL